MIIKILEDIGAREIQDHSKNVQCCCFLAPFRSQHRFGEDRRPSMGISISETQNSVVHCFSCGYSAPLVAALMYLEEKSEADITKVLNFARAAERKDPEALIASVEKHIEKESAPEVRLSEDLLEQYEIANRDGSQRSIKLKPGAHKRILERGLTIESLKFWESRWDSTFKRVMLPVRNSKGYLVGGVGRTVVPSNIKYFNYFRFDKSKYLFGEYQAKKDGRPVVVVEGLLDTVLMWQFFQQNKMELDVVGLLGSEASQPQLRKLARYWDDVIMFLDNDQTGWNGQRKIMRAIGHRVLLKTVRYPSKVGGDPADLVKESANIAGMLENASLVVRTRST